jgi:ATPase subunit of ABC transporter with duplicated ATPase domains
MNELTGSQKVRVLLAQALFGKPDILLLDEPTNHLDIQSIRWLESFLLDFENTVIVVSHDRHFLNKVCTHMADIDFGKIQTYVGNYDFWYESSQLALQLMKDQNKKKEEKIKELESFISRFSSNASKAKQATSRKKQLEKITLDDIKPSSRKYPFVGFKPEREAGNDILRVENLSKTIDGRKVLNEISFIVNKGDKIAFAGLDEIAKTTLFKILTGELEADSGNFSFGITTSRAYFPKDNLTYFQGADLSLVDWLRQYSEEKSESFIRGFLGRMLFSGDEALKNASVLSGGEKVRCMLAKMMLSGANLLILDEPTNHLDLESITAVNNGLINFNGTVLFSSHDHQFVHTIANRIIEITPRGIIDKVITYDEYLDNDSIQNQLKEMYA